jgi:hypothetical protein
MSKIRLIIDAGNAWVKAVCDNQSIAFPHAIAPVMPHEYEDGLKRYGKSNALDFVRINGNAFIIGETAEWYQTQHLTGEPKYTREYYGVLFAGVIARIFRDFPDTINGGLQVVASHASRDYEFHRLLIDSIRGRWSFDVGGVHYGFNVSLVETFEECFGSYARCAFQHDKKGNWHTPLEGKSVGIIDIGGGTTGIMMVDESGSVQYGASASGSQGINDVIVRLRTLLKRDFAKIFSRATEIPVDRLREALATRVYQGGGRKLDVSRQCELALNPLLNEVNMLYSTHLTGGVGIDRLILTGGGMALVGKTVEDMLQHGSTDYAGTSNDIQFANVYGMRTFYDVLQEAGL